PEGEFTATVDWGIAGHDSDPATVTQNPDLSYTVTALRPVYTAGGDYAVVVSISEDNASTTVNDSQHVSGNVALAAPPVVIVNQPAAFTVVDIADPARPVYLYDAGGNGLAFGVLDATGHATIYVTFQTPGTHIVTAVYDNDFGDPNHSSASIPVDVVLPFFND